MDNFNTAYYTISLLYGVELKPEEFEDMGLIAWNKIGNRRTRLYRFSTKINTVDNSVELPCNCDLIEAVTYSFEEWNYTTNDTVNGEYSSQFTENYIETRKAFSSPYYASGKYAKYERVGDTLYFDKDYGYVNILYKGIILDDEGLPEINEKENQAIACYCAYVKRFKEGWQTHSQLMLQEAQLLEQKWLKLCDAARVPIYINQNDMNEVLDVKTNWNRKIFNKSYKPMK